MSKLNKKQHKEVSQFMSEFVALLNYKLDLMKKEWEAAVDRVDDLIDKH